MRALEIRAPRRIERRDIAFSAPAGECRIRVRMAGICGTDLQLLEGYAGFRGVPGHEFAGVVEAADSDRDTAWVGRRVVGEINVGCGACEACRAGIKEHCVDRTVTGIRGRSGAFADYLSLPAANLHAIPDAMDDETAVFVEPTAAACRIFEQVPLTDQTRVGVLGDGRMGIIVAQVLRTVSPDVTLIGRHDRKLGVARDLGLMTEQADRRTSTAPRFDVVVDVTGRSDGLPQALTLARPRGTVVMKTTVHGEAPFTSWPAVVNEVTLVGSRCGPFSPAIALLASGAVQVKPLISRVLPLEGYAAAFDEARTGLKVLFAVDQQVRLADSRHDAMGL